MSGNVLGSAVLELRTDDSQLRAGIENARTQSQSLVGQFSATEQAAVRTGSAFGVMGTAAGSAGAQFQAAGGMVGGLSSGLVDVHGRALSSQTALQGVGTSAVAAGKGLDAAGTSAANAGKGAQSATQQVAGLGTVFSTTNVKAVAASMGMVGATVAIGQGLRAAVEAGVAFESAMAGVAKTTDLTGAELDALSMGIRQMAMEIPLAATEIAGIAEAAGQLGIEKENILSFTRVMADLGVATNMSSDQAATALARLANITQMSQQDFDRLGSAVVELGNNLATTEAEIVDMALRIAAAGTQIGLTEAEILGFAGALSSLGVEAQAGGTAISRVMIDIANAVAMGGEKLELFATTAGMSVDEFRTLFQEDAASAIIAFIEGLDAVAQSGGNVFAVLEELGLQDIRVRDALLRMAGGGDILRESIDMGNRAWEENIALTREAEIRYQTAASQLQIFKNTLTDVALSLFEVGDATGVTTTLIGGLSESAAGLSNLAQAIQSVADAANSIPSVLPEWLRPGGEGRIAAGWEAVGHTIRKSVLVGVGGPLALMNFFEAGSDSGEAYKAGFEQAMQFDPSKMGPFLSEVMLPDDAVFGPHLDELILGPILKMKPEVREELADIFTLSPEVGAQFASSIGDLMLDGQLSFAEGLHILGALPEEVLTPTLQGLQSEWQGMLVQALLSGEDTNHIRRGLDEINAALGETGEYVASSALGFTEFATAGEAIAGALDIASAAVDTFAGELGTLGGIQDVFQANIDYSAGRVSEWEGHLKGAERALGFLQDKIDAGIPLTAEQAEQYEILTGAVERYAGGIDDEMQGLVAAEVAKANYIKAQDELNAAIERGEKDLGPYKQALQDAAGELDPAAMAALGLTDAQGKLVEAISGVVDRLRDMLVELGLLPPETNTDVNVNTEDAEQGIFRTTEAIGTVPTEHNIGFTADEGAAVTAAQTVTKEIELVPSSKDIGFTAETGGAVYDIDGLTVTIDGVPIEKVTTFNAVDNASWVADAVEGRLNRLPSNFTVYINADAAGFYAAVEGVDNYIPRSPAKEGPFSRVPDWNFMWEGLPPSARFWWNKTLEEVGGVAGDLRTLGQLHSTAYATGITDGEASVADAAAGLTEATNTAVVEALGAGRHFQAETFLNQLNAFSEFLLEQVIASAVTFEAGLLDAAEGYMTAVKSGVGMLNEALALLGSLQSANVNMERARSAATALSELTQHIVVSIGDSASWVNAERPEGFLTQAEEYMTAAGSGVDLMQRGAELMATLSGMVGSLDSAKQAASDIKFLTEHIVLSIGDSAAYVDARRGEGFADYAASYADAAGKGVDLMNAGADLLLKLSGLSANLDQAKAAASDIKFLTEHIVLSIGDSAAYITATRGSGFIEHAGVYAEAAQAGIDLMIGAVEVMALLKDAELDLEIAKQAASDMKFLTEHIVASLGDSARLFDVAGLEHIRTYADAAKTGFEIMHGVAPVLESMLAFGRVDTSGIDLQARSTEMAELTRLIVAALQEAATHFDTSGLAAVTQFSEAATSGMDTMGKAGEALNAILLFATVDTSGYDLAGTSRDMVDLIVLVTRNMEAAAVHFETEGLESVERFASAAGTGLEVMATAGEALAAILMYGEMTPEGRDNLKTLAWEFTGVMDYLISMIHEVSTRYNTEAMSDLRQFSEDASASMKLIQDAARAFEAMVDHSRVTQEHADSFVHSWELMAWVLQEVATIMATQGVQEALRVLQSAEEIFAIMLQAAELMNNLPDVGAAGSTAPPPATSGGTSPPASSGSSSGSSSSYGDAVSKWIPNEYKQYMATGGIVTSEMQAVIGEGGKKEAVIPLENGGASIVAKELVDRMRAAPEWSRMQASAPLPVNVMAPPLGRRGEGDIGIHFNAPVTINARDRAEGEEAAENIAWGLRAARRKRGLA